MHQWFLSYDGKQIGPFDHASAIAHARRNPNGHCWRQGFAEWVPIASCAELSGEALPATMSPPPPSVRGSDQLDYRILGSDMQFVEVELDPGESVIAEAGAKRSRGWVRTTARRTGSIHRIAPSVWATGAPDSG